MTFATDGGIEWEKDETNKKLTIRPASSPESGYTSGQMKDYEYENPAPWSHITETGWTLIINSGVTYIGTYSFVECSGFIGTLTIPDSVTTIGNAVFGSCKGFTGTLTIPSSVTSIGGYAFNLCTGLTDVKFLGNQPVITSGAFELNMVEPAKTYNVYSTWANSTIFPEYPFTKWNYIDTTPKYVTKSAMKHYTDIVKGKLTDGGVTKVGTGTVGGTNKIIYLKNGVPTEGISITSGTGEPEGTPTEGSIYIKYTA